MKKISCSIIFILSNITLYAQAPEMEWFKGQGTSTEEHVHEGMQTEDGGYIAIGHGIESWDDDDMLIIKVDSEGNLEWKQEFGTAGEKGAGYCITEVTNGYIAGGAIYNADSLRGQRFLAKLDFDGDIIWEKFYPSTGLGGIRGLDFSSGYIAATGYKNTPNWEEFQGFVFIVDEGDGFIMKLDTDGNVEWEKTIDAPQGTKVREISDGYAVCATVWNWTPEDGDHQDFCLIKTDENGTTLWRECYGEGKNEHLYDFDLTQDGGYILGGHTTSYDVSNWDYLLMKIDSEGNEEWHKTFGQPRGYDADFIHDEAYGVRQTPEGGYIIAGGSGDEYSYSESGHPGGPSDEWKAYIVRTDENGEILWEGIYPPESVGNNAAEYIALTNDGGYIIFVDTDSQTPPNPNNFGFLKTSPDVVHISPQDKSGVIKDFHLYQNYPNPFNARTTIRYTLAKPDFIDLSIYDMLGKNIKTLVHEPQIAGDYNISWHAKDAPSGVYFLRIKAGSFDQMRKMLLLR